MEIPKPPIILRTHRSWTARLVDGLIDGWRTWRSLRQRRSTRPTIHLRELDAGTLADLGVDRCELLSVIAEARLEAELTRLRIAVLALHHA